LFKSDFSGLNKVREEHLESCRLKVLNDTIQLDHSYTLENTSFKMEDNFKKVITYLLRITVLNISRFVYHIELNDILTLQNKKWLSNFILDAALTSNSILQ